MAVTKIRCPKCTASLKSAAAIAAGAKIKCPKCGTSFGYEPEEEEIEVAEYAGYADRDGDVEDDEVPEEKVRPRKKLKKRKKADHTLLIRLASIGAVVLILGGGAFASFVWPGLLLTPTYSESLAFVPPGSELVAAADLEAIGDRLGISSFIETQIATAFTGFTGGILQPKQCKDKTGLEFKELCSHLTLAVDGNIANPAEPARLMCIVRSKVPFKKKKVLDFLGAVESPQSLNGKSYYKRTERGIDSFLFIPSNRLVIILSANHTNADLERVFASDPRKVPTDNEIMNVVNSVRQGHAWAAALPDPSALGNVGNMAGAGMAGPDLAPLLTALVKAKAMGAWLEVNDGQSTLNLTISATDASGATQIGGEAQKLWEKYKVTAAAGLAAAAFTNPQAKPFVDLGQELIQGVKIAIRASNVDASTQASTQHLKAALSLAATMSGGR